MYLHLYITFVNNKTYLQHKAVKGRRARTVSFSKYFLCNHTSPTEWKFFKGQIVGCWLCVEDVKSLVTTFGRHRRRWRWMATHSTTNCFAWVILCEGRCSNNSDKLLSDCISFTRFSVYFNYFRLAAALDAIGSNNNNTVCISESHPSDKNMSFCLSDDSDLSVVDAIKTKLYMLKWSI